MTANNLPAVTFLVAFTGTRSGVTVGADPNDPTITPIWTDLSHRLVTIDTKRGKSYELDEAEADEMTFKLRNNDGALDPTNTTSKYYPYVLPFRQFQLQVTYASVVYTVETGFIETWPQTWDVAGARGWSEALAVDALAALALIPLVSCLAAEVLLDNPVGYWMLGEPSGAFQGGQIAATGATPALTAAIGGGGGTSAFGTTLPVLIGAGATDGSTGPVTGNTTGFHFAPASTSAGTGLTASSVNVPAASAATVEIWVQDLTYTANPVAFLEISDSATGFSYLNLRTDGTASGFATSEGEGPTGAPADAISTVGIADGKLHHLVATWPGGGHISLYVDGALAATSFTSASAPNAMDTLTLAFGPRSSAVLAAYTVGHAAVYATALSAARVLAHYNAGVNAFPEDTGARFTRILKYAPWNLGSVVPAGNSQVLGLTDSATKTALAALLDVCAAESGNMYADNQGRVVFENRQNRMTQVAPVFTFGENTAGGELPYEGDVEVDFDPMNVFNIFQLQRPGGIAINESDATSLLRYFPRDYPKTPFLVPLSDDQSLIYLSQWLLSRYKDPHARVPTVSFRPTSNPALWVFCLTVQIGNRVRLNRRPQAAKTITLDLYVESVSHTYDASTGEWITALELSPAYWTNYEMVTAARGTLHTATIATATSFVLDVATTAGNTLDQDGWTAAAIPVIKILDGANTETLTVLTMTVAGSQATITTTAGAAHAHAAGVVIAENFSSAYTYNQFDSAAVLDGAHQVGY